jgi:hypothetical protein
MPFKDEVVPEKTTCYMSGYEIMTGKGGSGRHLEPSGYNCEHYLIIGDISNLFRLSIPTYKTILKELFGKATHDEQEKLSGRWRSIVYKPSQPAPNMVKNQFVFINIDYKSNAGIPTALPNYLNILKVMASLIFSNEPQILKPHDGPKKFKGETKHKPNQNTMAFTSSDVPQSDDGVLPPLGLLEMENVISRAMTEEERLRKKIIYYAKRCEELIHEAELFCTEFNKIPPDARKKTSNISSIVTLHRVVQDKEKQINQLDSGDKSIIKKVKKFFTGSIAKAANNLQNSITNSFKAFKKTPAYEAFHSLKDLVSGAVFKVRGKKGGASLSRTRAGRRPLRLLTNHGPKKLRAPTRISKPKSKYKTKTHKLISPLVQEMTTIQEGTETRLVFKTHEIGDFHKKLAEGIYDYLIKEIQHFEDFLEEVEGQVPPEKSEVFAEMTVEYIDKLRDDIQCIIVFLNKVGSRRVLGREISISERKKKSQMKRKERLRERIIREREKKKLHQKMSPRKRKKTAKEKKKTAKEKKTSKEKKKTAKQKKKTAKEKKKTAKEKKKQDK